MLLVALVAVRPGAASPVATAIVACVDSGAARSFFPLDIAYRLGIKPHELQQDQHGGMGVEGAGFPTFSSIVPIEGIVMALIGPSNSYQAWGPRFSLRPAFSDKDPLLLGRDDFFQTFTITFQENARAPIFHLDY